MRAAVLEEAGKPVEIRQDVEIAAPKAGQVSVEVRHCGLCHSDLSIIDGVFPGMMPLVLGHEAAGIVAEVGPGVTSLVPGDHVVLTPTPPCGAFAVKPAFAPTPTRLLRVYYPTGPPPCRLAESPFIVAWVWGRLPIVWSRRKPVR